MKEIPGNRSSPQESWTGQQKLLKLSGGSLSAALCHKIRTSKARDLQNDLQQAHSANVSDLTTRTRLQKGPSARIPALMELWLLWGIGMKCFCPLAWFYSQFFLQNKDNFKNSDSVVCYLGVFPSALDGVKHNDFNCSYSGLVSASWQCHNLSAIFERFFFSENLARAIFWD